MTRKSFVFGHCVAFVALILTALLFYQEEFQALNSTIYSVGSKFSSRARRKTPQNEMYIGLAFSSCNGLANQMQRQASLLGIGLEVGRTPFINSAIKCGADTLPELAATMPNFFDGIVVTPAKNQVTIPFTLNVCHYVNASILQGKYSQYTHLILQTPLLQSYKYFHHIKPRIRQMFEFSDAVKKVVSDFANQLFKNSTLHKLCVHSRRGDFVRNRFLLPSRHSFIRPALDLILPELHAQFGPIALVLVGQDLKFSHEIKANRTLAPATYVPSGLSRTEELHFGATHCDSLLISASGSTFGWWMGYLMAEERQRRVFYNYVATRDARNCRDRRDFDTFPPAWRRVRSAAGAAVFERRWHDAIRRDEGPRTYANWTRVR